MPSSYNAAFGDKKDTQFLKKALQILIQSDVPIKTVTFLENEFIGYTQEGRAGRYDLVCEDEQQQVFIVEMQLAPSKHYLQRVKLYAFHLFNTMVRKGKDGFEQLKKIYCISLMGHTLYAESKQFYHYGTLKNQAGELLDWQMTHIIVEIRKFDKQFAVIVLPLKC